MQRYIQRKSQGGEIETVDQFNYDTKADRKEFKEALVNYRISDKTAQYYSSQRACKDWKN